MNIVSKYNVRGINYCFLNIGCSCDPVQQPSYRKRIILSSPGDNIHYTSTVNIFVNILKMYLYLFILISMLQVPFAISLFERGAKNEIIS